MLRPRREFLENLSLDRLRHLDALGGSHVVVVVSVVLVGCNAGEAADFLKGALLCFSLRPLWSWNHGRCRRCRCCCDRCITHDGVGRGARGRRCSLTGCERRCACTSCGRSSRGAGAGGYSHRLGDEHTLIRMRAGDGRRRRRRRRRHQTTAAVQGRVGQRHALILGRACFQRTAAVATRAQEARAHRAHGRPHG